MLLEDFAKRHSLCPEGEEMMRPYLQKTVRECWEDVSMPARGTWLMWIVSRAQLDHKSIVACACRCTREVLAAFPDPAKAAAAIDVIEGWCEGRKSKADALAVGEQAHKAANQVKGTPQFIAWSAIVQLSSCVQKAIKANAVTGAVAQALEAAGKGPWEKWDEKLAAYVREAFPWSSVQLAITDERPSPAPRPSTPEQVAERTKSRIAETARVLADSQAAFDKLDTFCRGERVTLDGVSRLLDQAEIGPVRPLVEGTVRGMASRDAQDAGPAGTDKPKAPKRGRVMV